jgi:hypothetical protein
MLSLPQNLELRFFAYGAFKPGELAFTQIERFLEQQPTPATASGSLKVRDGLPLFDNRGGGSVHGFLLTFSKDCYLSAYETICRFEPQAIYFWKEAILSSPTVSANLLVGKKFDRGRPHDLEGNSWSFRLDPVFNHGLRVVEDTVTQLGYECFASAPPEHFDWPRFFRLQMAYLLFWSAIERFSAFAYGPALSPEQRIKALGSDPRFLSALEKHLSSPSQEVSDSRDPGDRSHLDVERPEKAAGYFYQVRSNLSHRGKGAWSDGEIVRQSLITLLAVFKDMLSSIEVSYAPNSVLRADASQEAHR